MRALVVAVVERRDDKHKLLALGRILRQGQLCVAGDGNDGLAVVQVNALAFHKAIHHKAGCLLQRIVGLGCFPNEGFHLVDFLYLQAGPV